MAFPSLLERATDWIQANASVSPQLAGVLLGAAGLLGLLILFWVLKVVFRWAFAAASSLSLSAKARKAPPGYRILVAPPAGGRRSAYKFLAKAAGEHMSSFSFDAPLQVFKTSKISGGRDARSERIARKRLKRSGADLIIWGEQVGRGGEGLDVFTLSRAGGLTPDEAVLQHFALPSSSKDRAGDVGRVAAYLLAKRLQPSLGRPADFRAERLEPVAVQLGGLLEAGRDLSPRVRNELERDFSAAALHVGEASNDNNWLDQVITLRRATLDRLGSAPQAGIWAEAKLDLGRALIAKAARRFDPRVIAEGSGHLREAIEILKADPSIKRAEDAMRTLDSARALAANRERFSINFGA